MQISQEFISLGGKQNKPPEAFLLPPAIPEVARSPRPAPRPRRCPCWPGGALQNPHLLSVQSAAVFANIDIAACVPRIINCRCGDAVRPGPGAGGHRHRATGAQPGARCPRRQRAAGEGGGRGGSGRTLGERGTSPSWAVLGGFLSFTTSS